ncbi:hypothetical protein J2X68_007239 [Streptomyces sp. 3330]|uniref:hypothetical protein n=1 Tax=Streptomyces sp. 3330 TaxID=2817755 RepID=UPI0028608CE2|nr:hypothetical protein [Streptomyces sp. 3330]MDR6980499.1 hypothetical protein [Streptomyces sp. 3330]
MLALYTGMSYQQAFQIAGATRRRDPLIPRPEPAQELLERWVLRTIAWPTHDPVYPWGIVWARPEKKHLTLRIDGEATAAEFARVLPPRIDEDGQVLGIPGARISQPDERGITVSLLGTPARVRIAGVAARVWREVLAAAERQAHENENQVSCQQRSPWRWTDEEQASARYLGALSVVCSHRAEDTAWLASGVLRRVGLWRTLGVPLSTTSWTNPMKPGEQWIIEHIHHAIPEVDRHDTFLRLLTAPGWGLPVKVTDTWCSCERGDAGCQVTVTSPAGLAGELQLRFSRRTDPCTWHDFSPEEHRAREGLTVRVKPWMLKAVSTAAPVPSTR